MFEEKQKKKNNKIIDFFGVGKMNPFISCVFFGNNVDCIVKMRKINNSGNLIRIIVLFLLFFRRYFG